MVAWCSKPGYGTRLIPAGTLTGLQFLKTPDYIQIVGFMDQTQINMASGDYGGEMDPHGADLVSLFQSIFVRGASPRLLFARALSPFRRWTPGIFLIMMR